MLKKRGLLSTTLFVLAAATLVIPAFAQEANNKPCLSQPEFRPLEGGLTRTTYVASVRYSDPDGDPPARISIYVDGEAYPLRFASGKVAKGVYRARLTLPKGEHTYYFQVEDARGQTERLPRYGAWRGPFVGSRAPYNRLPILSEGGVHYASSTSKDIYTYTVRYQDKDGKAPPRQVRVFIDGIPHQMKLHSGEPNDGIYLYETCLAPGSHHYYFSAEDDRGDCVSHPRYGFIRGPEVYETPNSPPRLSSNRITPPIGNHLSRYTYTVEYRDADNDPAALALIYIDGIPHQMSLAAGKPYNGLYVYRTKHFLAADHQYYFYFEDGRGGVCRFPERGSFHGPVVMK